MENKIERDLRENVLVFNGCALDVNKYLLAKHSLFFREQFFTHNNFEIVEPSLDVEVFKELLGAIDSLERGQKVELHDKGKRPEPEWIEAFFQMCAKFQFSALLQSGSLTSVLSHSSISSVFRFRLAKTYNLGMSENIYCCTNEDLAEHLSQNLEEFANLNTGQRRYFALCCKLARLFDTSCHFIDSIKDLYWKRPIKALGLEARGFGEQLFMFFLSFFLISTIAGLFGLFSHVCYYVFFKEFPKFMTGLAFTIIGPTAFYWFPWKFLFRLTSKAVSSVGTLWKFLFGLVSRPVRAVLSLVFHFKNSLLINGMLVNVDKWALAAHSPYFQRFFFDQRFVEGNRQRFEINDPSISAQDFEALYATAIFGRMPKSDKIETVLVLADRFALPLPNPAFADHLLECRDKPALFKLRMACEHGLDGLKQRLLNRMCDYEQKLAMADDFVANALEYERMEKRHRELLKNRLTE